MARKALPRTEQITPTVCTVQQCMNGNSSFLWGFFTFSQHPSADFHTPTTTKT